MLLLHILQRESHLRTCNKKILFVKKYQPVSGGIGVNYHTNTIHKHTHNSTEMLTIP